MRKVFYELENGVRTTSHDIAIASGQNFVVKVEPVHESRKPLSEKRKKAIAEFFRKQR